MAKLGETLWVFSGDGVGLARGAAWVAWTPVRALRRTARGRRLRAWAAAHGLRFEATRPDLAERWDLERGPAPLLKRRVRTALRSARNVVSGTLDGRPVVIFEAEWAVDESEVAVEQFRRRQVVAVGMPGPVPPLQVRGRVWDDLKHGLRTESADFNDAWYVRAVDERAAHGLLAPHVIAAVQGLPPKQTDLQFHGADLVQVRKGYVRGPAEIESMLGVAKLLVEAIPPFVFGR